MASTSYKMAAQAVFENKLDQQLFSNGKKSCHIKMVYRNAEPRVGFSEFYYSKGQWYPGKKHFFFSIPEWKHVMGTIQGFNEQVEKGAIHYLNILYIIRIFQ